MPIPVIFAPFNATATNGAHMANTEVLDDYLTERILAAQLYKSERTLQRWRRLRIGPTPTIVGNKILYAIDDVRTWLHEQRQVVA